MTLRGLAADKFSTFHRWLPPTDENGIPEAGREATFVARFHHPDAGKIAAYGKFYPGLGNTSRGLVNEITGHVIARHFGLPVPDPAFVAEIPIKKLPLRDLAPKHDWLKKLARKTAVYPAWCTIEVNAPTPWHHFGSVVSNALINDLNEWNDLPRAVVLDHIVANVDRNLRNLLRTGRSSYTLIDHGRLVSNSHWSRGELIASASFPNLLDDFVSPRRNERGFTNQIVFAAEECGDKGTQGSGTDPWWHKLLCEEDRIAFDKFLNERARFAAKHFTSRYSL